MGYVSLMVHLQLGQSNAGLLKITGHLAERFKAGVIGVAACQPLQVAYDGPYYSGDLIQWDREAIEKDASEARNEFHSLLAPRVARLEWRSNITFEPLYNHFARQARGADLIITATDRASILNRTHHFNISDLVMRAGRPVLVVPPAAEHLKLDRVLVGWNDSREARRAVLDALPLLQTASHVAVAEIAPEERLLEAQDHVGDVVAWLALHGIKADAIASPRSGTDAGGLAQIAAEQAADIIVAGAYGHSRMREWALGGVTNDLLLGTARCAFLSH